MTRQIRAHRTSHPTRSRKRLILRVLLILGVLFVAWTIWGNMNIQVTEYTHRSAQVPEAFEGYRMVQISDLHHADFGTNHSQIMDALAEIEPDSIAITGDLIDSGRYAPEIALDLVQQVVEVAPTYYVTGNHEAWLGDRYAAFVQTLSDAGVQVLDNQALTVERGDQSIQIIGVDDPEFTDRDSALHPDIMRQTLDGLVDEAPYTVLLSHRPELFTTYVDAGVDLVLSGHAHGGQFRLPGLGGLVAPDQGFLPRYDAGRFDEARTTMVVSRGIGNSIIPVRILNRPELVVIELATESP